MTVRHIWIAMVVTVAACGHAPQTVPSVAPFGPDSSHASTLPDSRTWFVDGMRGSNKNDCASRRSACKTIGHAVSLTSSGDRIIVAAAIYPENITIRHSLEIEGAGAATTIIDGRGVASEIISPHPGSVVTVSKMTLRNGGGQGDGGGIYNCTATLTIVDSIISGNTATRGLGNLGYGGGIYNCPGSTMTIIDSTLSKNSAEAGGAICNGGTLTIRNSTFSGNEARRRRGGGIFNYGTLAIDNSTLSGNDAPSGIGGAIHNGVLFGQTGTLTIDNSTISRNTAGDGRGGGIFNLNGASTTLRNSIVSDNTGRNCSGAVVSQGHDLSSDDTCDFHAAGDLNETDPELGPLHDNGGPTMTMALPVDSPAVDAGDPRGCTDFQGHLLRTDQRGEPRPDDEDSHGCDMGAYERQDD